MPRIFHLLLACAALCLFSCTLQTHQRVLDLAKEYEATVLLHDAVYQKGNRFYVKGVRTTVRRSERSIWSSPLSDALGRKPERTGVYTIVPGAVCKPVYSEFTLRYGRKPFDAVDYAYSSSCYSNCPPDDDAPVWKGDTRYEEMGWHPYRNKKGEIISWFQYVVEDIHHRDYKGKWRDTLPEGARPICMTAEQIAHHPFLKGETGVGYVLVDERSEPRINKSRAWYAYPLAGICWLVPDAPVTVASNLSFAPLLLIVGASEAVESLSGL